MQLKIKDDMGREWSEVDVDYSYGCIPVSVATLVNPDGSVTAGYWEVWNSRFSSNKALLRASGLGCTKSPSGRWVVKGEVLL